MYFLYQKSTEIDMHISIIISYSISVPFEHCIEYDIDQGLNWHPQIRLYLPAQ